MGSPGFHPAEIGSLEACVVEPGLFQSGAFEVRSIEHRPGKVDPREIFILKIDSCEIFANEPSCFILPKIILQAMMQCRRLKDIRKVMLQDFQARFVLQLMKQLYTEFLIIDL